MEEISAKETAEKKGVTFTDEGAEIPLKKPITVAGMKVGRLKMREPTVGDSLALDGMSGSKGKQETAMVANLCMLSPEDMRSVSLKDYATLTAALMAFLE